MRIDGWHIDGFGVFHQHEVRDLGSGFTVFQGPNEAGKSTLLAFLRGTLFGFPHGNSREPRYPALRGGTPGGRLFLSDEVGALTVERQVGRRAPPLVLRADGSALDEDELHRLLGGCDKQLFESVFAFSLAELQSFEKLSADGIRDRIFSAGIAGAGRSARQVIGELKTRAEARVRPRSGPAYEMAGELQEVERALEAARNAALGYPQLLRDEEDTLERLHAARDLAAAATADASRYALLIELWPAQARLDEARRELGAMPASAGLAEDAEARLTEVLAAAGNARERRDAAGTELERELGRVAELEAATDDRLPPVAGRVAALHGELALLRQRLAELPEARRARDAAAAELRAALDQLGAGWDEARVVGFDRSIPRAEAVRAWEQELRDARERAREAERHAGGADAAAHDARAEVDRLRSALPAVEPRPRAELDGLDRMLRAARSALHERDALGARRDQWLREAEQAELALHDEPPAASGEALAGPVLLAAGLVLAGVAAWAVQRGDAGVAAGLGVLALALFGLGIVLRGSAARRRSQAESRAAARDARRDSIARVRADAAAASARIEAVDVQLAELAAGCELQAPVTAAALDEREASLVDEREARRDHDDALTRIGEAEHRLRGLTEVMASRRGQADAAAAAVHELETGWTAWKAELDLPPDLSPQGVIDFFRSIEAAREASRVRDHSDLRFRSLAGEVAAWQDRAGAVLADAGATAADARPADDLVPAVLDLHARCEHDRALRQRLEAARESAARCRNAVTDAQARWESAAAEQAALFAAAGAADEDEYRGQLRVARQRAALEEEIRALERQLDVRLGRGDDAARMRSELGSGQVTEWESAAATAGGAAAAAQAEAEQCVRDHENARNQRLALEESADIPRLEAERERVRAGFVGAIEEWRTAELARALVEETLRVFERERQPAVLAAAAATFQTITAGRYTAVQQDVDRDGELRVIEHTGAARGTGELSRGTAEQLYLALRIGLIEEFAHRAVAMPVVMDDCFVNFDPARARRVAGALAALAERNQVLVFTCHRSTARLLRRAGAEVRTLPGPGA